MTSESVTQSSAKSSLGFWFLLLSPVLALLYFTQLNEAFVRSIDSVLDSARLERELYLVPHSQESSWGDHYIYRFVAGCASVALATFVCGGLTRDRGKWAGLVGGLSISSVMGFFFAAAYFVDSEFSIPIGHIVVSAALLAASPVIGWYAGNAGEELSVSKDRGFAGIPRFQFLWLWIPLYFYGLLLIGPLVNLFWSDAVFSFFSYIKAILPVVIFGAPAVCGLLIMSGDLLEKWPGYIRQIIGPVVILGGAALLAVLMFWLYGMAQS